MLQLVTPPGVIVPGFDRPMDLRVWVPGEWVVLGNLGYVSLSGKSITVPRSFITDLASIPQLAQALFPIDDASRMPAVLHDWLYCSKALPRDQADAIFHEALLRAGVNRVKARAMWSAVRAGGWAYFNKRDGVTTEDFAIIL